MTGVRPDIVILNKKSKKIDIFELTFSFEKNIQAANKKKSDKYVDLESDLKKAGWTTSLTPFEVGSRGQVTKQNEETIKKMTRLVQTNTKAKKIITSISRISLLASFSIFQARCQPTWESPPHLHP